MLIDNRADVNAKAEEYGSTPLHSAVRKAYDNASKTAEVLLQHGADVNATFRMGRTPLDIALENDNNEVSRVLRRYKGWRKWLPKGGIL